MNYLICSIGHTTAGKTTTLKALGSYLNCAFISEGTIKRNLVGESFGVKNSMDEELRSRGYKIAIEQAINQLQTNPYVILDASFHQLFRRLWIYEEIRKQPQKMGVIWIYCYCDDVSEVMKRIDKRAKATFVTADIQARSMEVYYYTMNTFDRVDIKDFPADIPTSIIYNNTKVGSVDKICNNCSLISSKAEEIGTLIYGRSV